MRNAVWMLGLAVAVGACRDVTEPRDDVAAYVRIVDERGAPLRPDAVTWHHDPISPRFDGEHPAECANRGCTEWVLPAEADGAAYVAARWSRPLPGAAPCSVRGRDVRRVDPSAASPPTVVLRLSTRAEICP
jgi:hypothetical protein